MWRICAAWWTLMGEAHDAMAHLHGPVLLLDGRRDQLVPPAATASAWDGLPASVRRGFYPNGYHLLLRDRDRALVEADILAWLDDPDQLAALGCGCGGRGVAGAIMPGRATCPNWRRRPMTASGRNPVWPY